MSAITPLILPDAVVSVAVYSTWPCGIADQTQSLRIRSCGNVNLYLLEHSKSYTILTSMCDYRVLARHSHVLLAGGFTSVDAFGFAFVLNFTLPPKSCFASRSLRPATSVPLAAEARL